MKYFKLILIVLTVFLILIWIFRNDRFVNNKYKTKDIHVRIARFKKSNGQTCVQLDSSTKIIDSNMVVCLYLEKEYYSDSTIKEGKFGKPSRGKSGTDFEIRNFRIFIDSIEITNDLTGDPNLVNTDTSSITLLDKSLTYSIENHPECVLGFYFKDVKDLMEKYNTNFNNPSIIGEGMNYEILFRLSNSKLKEIRDRFQSDKLNSLIKVSFQQDLKTEDVRIVINDSNVYYLPVVRFDFGK